jgi:hypothetical protein
MRVRIPNVNYAQVELRTAIGLAFDRLRALYEAQEANPFGGSLERQIRSTRALIANLSTGSSSKPCGRLGQ